MASIDWDEHWREGDEPEGARRFAVEMAARLGEFIKTREMKRFADFGCGPTTTLFELAVGFPGIQFFGYDTAASILGKNREKAREHGLVNLHFERDVLPNPKTKEKFDVVTCFSTLHYVGDIGRAIGDLFGLMSPGDCLIFNYPNKYTRTAKRNEIDPDDECMKRRFALVLDGKNLTSMKKIGEILGERPRRFYSSRRHNVYVAVQKRTQA
jgi:trans-aconitate methyltransferase